MSRVFSIPIFVVMLALTACGPSAPPAPILPTFLSPQDLATPDTNAAYPTQQAQLTNSNQTVSGFSVDLQRAWRDGKQVYADVCYTTPDASDWTIWNARFEYSGEDVSEFGSTMLSKQEATQDQAGQRCDALRFYVPPDADLSSASLIIDSLGAYPSQDEYCSLYMPKIQQALNDRGISITLDCADVNGAMTMQISQKPDTMTQDAADQMVYSDEFYTVNGPWTYPLNLNQ